MTLLERDLLSASVLKGSRSGRSKRAKMSSSLTARLRPASTRSEMTRQAKSEKHCTRDRWMPKTPLEVLTESVAVCEWLSLLSLLSLSSLSSSERWIWLESLVRRDDGIEVAADGVREAVDRDRGGGWLRAGGR